MKLIVVAVGRVKHTALREACRDYEQRIGRYLTFEVREVGGRGAGSASAALVLRAEARALLSALPARARVFAVTREGISSSTRTFTDRLTGWIEGGQDVALLLGGAYGLDRQVLERAEGRLSLSPLTFSHELARLVLFEQLYRACTIRRNEPYHKGAT